MPIPNVKVELYLPGAGWRDVSAACSLESSIEITEAIEGPTETNAFVAPNVLLKLVADGSGVFTFDVFANLLPESTNYLVRISRDGVVFFYGFVLPNTLQFDDAERWASFTALGIAGKLARTAADSSPFLRRATIGEWRVHEASGNEFLGTVLIYNTTGPTGLCELLAGDTIEVTTPGGQTDELVVQGVAPTTATVPYPYFELTVTGLKQAYESGSIVTLATPFIRNISVKSLIDVLFQAAGLNATTGSTFLAAPLAGASAPFATPPSTVGIEYTSTLGLSSFVTDIIGGDSPGAFPLLGTATGQYRQPNPPTGNWEYDKLTNVALYPVDWRPYGSWK